MNNLQIMLVGIFIGFALCLFAATWVITIILEKIRKDIELKGD